MAVTLKDLARELGVSITTVSRGLAGYDDVAEDTQLRIRDTADRLGYQPNLTARRLQKQQTGILGFIMPTFGPRFSDPFFSEFIAGIGNEAANHDYDLLVSTHAPDSDEERKTYQRAVTRAWVDGLIVVRTREEDARIQLLCQHNFPFVAFGRTDDEYDFPFVDEDGEAGMRALVQHFIDLGHRHIAFISPPSGLMFGRYRLKGFQDTMADNGLPVLPGWIVEGDMTQRGGAELTEQILALTPRPTAILAGNDLMALGVMNRLQQHGLTVGEDVAVGGFDDIPLVEHTHPPLTTIHQPIYEIGRRTCAMLIDIINGRAPANPHVLLTPTLVVRASSGQPIA
ncbi:MAG: LacI family transcriptional regulator [Chloroflexi bacterium]|nr:LacI family transcriptional regulator [Chloroflexota bacterium]